MSVIRRDFDDKAARMLEIYATQSFSSRRSTQRLRLHMVGWVIRNKIKSNIKRGLDLFLGSLALLFTLPAMLIAALLVKATSPGPVLFRQERVGMRGRSFTCFKFRTMHVDADARKEDLLVDNEADGPIFKMRDDPRVTPVGRLLRKTSVDELPQLFNVLRGEMSLVGPRPAVPVEVAGYDYYQLQRLDALPGITGLQQVSGRSELAFKRWIELDLQYIEEQSLLTDLKILIKTIPAVIIGRGAY